MSDDKRIDERAALIAAFRRGVEYRETTNYPAGRLSDSEILAKLLSGRKP